MDDFDAGHDAGYEAGYDHASRDAAVEITALRERVKVLEGALFNAAALIGHTMPMDTTALVAGEKLVARKVWNEARRALGGDDGR